MDFVGFIAAINKVALFFFTVTLGFVIYEFVMFLRDRKQDGQPTVPAFDPNTPLPQATPIHTAMERPALKTGSKAHRGIQLIVALIIFTIITIGMVIFRPQQTEQLPSTPGTPQSIRPTALPTSTTQVKASPTPESQVFASDEAELASPTAALSLSPTTTMTPTPTPTTTTVVIAESSASVSATLVPTTADELPTAGFRLPLEMFTVLAAVVITLAFIF